jgi:hypothetical protein
MILGLGVKALLEMQDPEWIAQTIPLHTEDTDAVEIDKLLVAGKSPEEAAHHLFDHGVPVRRLEGLKYLAREREALLMETLGETIDTLSVRVMEGNRVLVHPRRMRRLVCSLEKDNVEVEVLYSIRRAD